MVTVSGANWSGRLIVAETTKASGSIDGYSWYFQSNGDSFFVEIAEDNQITSEQLPLVGYGCAGWLYEDNWGLVSDSEQDLTIYLEKQLSLVFSLFKQNKLKYLPAVSCPCSE